MNNGISRGLFVIACGGGVHLRARDPRYRRGDIGDPQRLHEGHGGAAVGAGAVRAIRPGEGTRRLCHLTCRGLRVWDRLECHLCSVLMCSVLRVCEHLRVFTCVMKL